MKSLGMPALVLFTFAAALPFEASAQTAAPRAGQFAPAPRPAAAAPVKAPAPPSSAPAPGATAPKSAPVKMRVPANLFKLPDSEIIFVGGKQVSAGTVRQDLKAQVLAAAGPPKLVRVASRKTPGQTKMPISADAAALLARNRPNDKAPAIIDCTQQAPTILAIQGAVASGQQFTLIGTCFGEQNGDVKIIGQFPGGNLHVSSDPVHPGITFTSWTAGRIVAAIPAVTGSTDQTVAISVTTHVEKRESPARQASFTAARQRVEVPARLWTPGTHLEFIWNTADGTNIHQNDTTNPMKFEVTVNPACVLDNLEVHAAAGKITAINGWADGPPSSSTVQIGYEPQHTVTSYWYSVVDDVFSSAIFDVKAWADCPVGIAP